MSHQLKARRTQGSFYFFSASGAAKVERLGALLEPFQEGFYILAQNLLLVAPFQDGEPLPLAVSFGSFFKQFANCPIVFNFKYAAPVFLASIKAG